MCLAVPGRISDIDEDMMAEIDYGNLRKKASLELVPGADIGQWVLVHAGFAVQLLDEAVAQETLALLREWIQDE